MNGTTLFPADEADLYVRTLVCRTFLQSELHIGTVSVLDSYDGRVLGLLYIYMFPVEV